jgi:hypothetical protein
MPIENDELGVDQFIREVIQIVRVEKLHIDISEHGWIEVGPVTMIDGEPVSNKDTGDEDVKTLPNLDRVHVEFSGVRPATDADPFDYHFHATAIGRSIGECLRKIREQIRTQLGK